MQSDRQKAGARAILVIAAFVTVASVVAAVVMRPPRDENVQLKPPHLVHHASPSAFQFTTSALVREDAVVLDAGGEALAAVDVPFSWRRVTFELDAIGPPAARPYARFFVQRPGERERRLQGPERVAGPQVRTFILPETAAGVTSVSVVYLRHWSDEGTSPPQLLVRGAEFTP